MLEQISEQEIKQRVLRYLKTYYKFRPRAGETAARYDMVTTSGIIADGYVSFPVSPEKTFLATFEATSYATKHEVVYSVMWPRLLWDSAALASVLTVCIFLYVYLFLGISFAKVGFLPTIGLTLFAALIFFLSYISLFKRRPIYRKIYAIEQFKMYNADEQWVALGEDVFANHADPFLVELKKQCVVNGFGLLSVTTSGLVSVLISPAREQVLVGRANLTFFDQSQILAQRISKNIQDRFKGWLQNIGSRMPWQERTIFKGSFLKQQFLVTAAAVIVASILLKEYDKSRPTVELSRRSTVKMLTDIAQNLEEEDELYEVDTSSVFLTNTQDSLRHVRLKKPKVIDGNALDRWKKYPDDSLYNIRPPEEVPDKNRNLAQKEKEAEMPAYIPVVVPEDGFMPPKYVPVTVPTKDGKASNDYSEDDAFTPKSGETTPPSVAPAPPPNDAKPLTPLRPLPEPCQQFDNLKGKRYIVQDNAYADKAYADARQALLRKKGFDAYVVWLGCFEDMPDYHAVVFKRFYTKRSDAEMLAKTYYMYLKNKKLATGNLLVRELTLKR
jgi:hypothetical protein